jgi:hypothetical protein
MWADIVYACATIRDITATYALDPDWPAANDAYLHAVHTRTGAATPNPGAAAPRDFNPFTLKGREIHRR